MSSISKDQLLALANQVLPTLPVALLFGTETNVNLVDMFNQLNRAFIHNNLDTCEYIPLYMYFNNAYEATNNHSLKPLIEYFKPTRDTLMNALHNFISMPTHLRSDILENHGFSSLDEITEVIQNAFDGKKDNGLLRLNDVRSYIIEAKTISEVFLSSFTEEDYEYDYDEMAPDIYLIRSIYKPLLFYFDFIERELVLNRFKETFYSLKYKQRFRSILWEKVREPKIRARYHPNNMIKMLEQRGDIDVDELDALMDQW